MAINPLVRLMEAISEGTNRLRSNGPFWHLHLQIAGLPRIAGIHATRNTRFRRVDAVLAHVLGAFLEKARERGLHVPWIKHAPRWMLALGARPAGAAVRALTWIGPNHAHESLATLRRTLPSTEWQALTSARATLPGWMAQAIGEEAAHD